MFPDLCWGSFNYNTYKANISLFPKWIQKFWVMSCFLLFLIHFTPPKHSESILFRYHLGGCQPTKGFFTYQQGSRTWTLSLPDYDLMSLIWHMYFPMVGMIHDTNFFEFVEVTPTFCNTIRVSEITTELKGFGPNCLQNGEISCNSKSHCRLWSQNSLPKL